VTTSSISPDSIAELSHRHRDPLVLAGQLALPFTLEGSTSEAAIGPRSAPRPRTLLARTGGARPARPLRALEPSERSPEELALEQRLADRIPKGRALSVRLTDNRYTMVMVRRAPSEYVVRLHRMFADADGALVRAIARYVVANDARASAVIGAFIERNQHVIAQQPQRQRRVVVRTAGRCHDLQAMFDQLNHEYFGGALQARITWGSAPRRLRPRRSIKMGSFAVEDRLIRIHPVLDDPGVPNYFVAWIVFHEMLHGKFEVVRKGDRRCFHSKEFLAEERTFRDYERASAWERANIDRLLGPATVEPAV
jgi:predicted metal-dependent hydrolase